MNPQELYGQAALLHQGGRAAEAERLCSQILGMAPEHEDARYLLGVIHFQRGHYNEAMQVLAAALGNNPNAAGPLLLYGLLLQKARHFDEALAHFERASSKYPALVEAIVNRGNVLCDMGRYAEALASFDKAQLLRPGFGEALYNRGLALRGLSRAAEALASFDAVLTLRPGLAEALVQRGITLAMMKRFEEALTSYDRALAVRPAYSDAYSNRGDALRELERNAEALKNYDMALVYQPDNAVALNNRGSVLQLLKRFDEARESYDRALAARPDFAEALVNRGTMEWVEFQRLAPALRDLSRAAQINPDCDYLRGDLLHLRMAAGDWRDFEEQVARIGAGVKAGARAAKPFTYLAISKSPTNLKACAVLYTRTNYPPAPSLAIRKKSGNGKIRLGYLSGEFRQQATAFLTAGLYERHDKSRFELVAFDNGWSDNSPLRGRLEAAFDKFIAISQLTDSEAVQRIHDEDIDILVNLNGYFGRHRMGVFARRPARLQVNYLGFPGTLGAPYMDYIIADRTVIPDSERQFYTEQVVTLPHSYQVNDSRRAPGAVAPSRIECGLPQSGFVFCSFNQSYKLMPAMFAIWMRILRRVDGSVLWLLESNGEVAQNLRREAAGHGVAGERLVFAPMIMPEKHLARQALADLFLDTLPCNAHTTASDALWAGLPLLTCRGGAFPGRVAASLLQAIGLSELVTENLEEYEALAIRLAGDPQALQAIRTKILSNRSVTPLFDTDRFARAIEAAYGRMWDIAERGLPPQGFAVGDEKS